MSGGPTPPVVRLDPGLFLTGLAPGSKRELFSAFVSALAERGVTRQGEALLGVLLEREAVGTTATGAGIALPHLRSHVVEGTALAFARLAPPLDFGAADGLPVQVALLLVAPHGAAGARYWPLLAVLAEAAHDAERRRRLLAIETFAELEHFVSHDLRRRLREALAR